MSILQRKRQVTSQRENESLALAVNGISFVFIWKGFHLKNGFESATKGDGFLVSHEGQTHSILTFAVR